MISNQLYRHPRCLDVDFFIVKVQYESPTYIKVKIKYWHRTLKEFIFPDPETVKIQKKDWPNWTPVLD